MYWNLDKVIVSQNEDLPVDWKKLFPHDRMLVEIGFGNGEFLEFLAGNDPEALVVGIEVSQLCAAKGARRAMCAGLGNVRIMHGDARFLLRQCFPPQCAERVYMNFPCPWPKTRNALRRVTVPSFSGLMERLIAPGGAFELATDVEWYAREAAEAFDAAPSFKVETLEKNPLRPYLTKYERKWKAMGKDTWRLVARREGPAFTENECEGDWPMECEADTKKSAAELAGALKGREGRAADGSGHWVFRDAFISDDGAALMLVITADEGFEQHFYIKLLESPRGITVKVDSVGHPFRTPSMRAALMAALDAAK
ncbi:MAG: tRNA (guanosine(46)-N7)-methyltransferase TrmB [Synergistes sp.]|nr:tRNA (guanosine(46)-N7)-methyltransferase TrmB [Synergistes sp.]